MIAITLLSTLLIGLGLTISNRVISRALIDRTDTLRELTAANGDLKRSISRERQLAYFNEFANAESEYRGNHLQRAEEILDLCRPEFRGWEWKYLKRLCNPGCLLTIQAGVIPGGWMQSSVPLTSSRNCAAIVSQERRTVRIIDLSTGAAIQEFEPKVLPVCMTSSSDGLWLALFGASPYAAGAELRSSYLQIWNLATNREHWLKTLPSLSYGCQIALSPDGRWAAAATSLHPQGGGLVRPGPITIWAISSGEEVFTTPRMGSFEDSSILFSPDGKWLVYPDNMGINVRDTATWQLVKSLPTGRVKSMAFCPDSQQIAVVTDGTSSLITIWSVLTGQQLQTLHGHLGQVFSVDYSSDGKQLVTVGADATMRIWDAVLGNEVRVLRNREPFHAVAFCKEDQRLIAITKHRIAPDGNWSNVNELRTWDLGVLPEAALLAPPADTKSGSIGYELDFSPDGNRLACGYGESVVIWDTATRQISQILRDAPRENVLGNGRPVDAANCLPAQPDGRRSRPAVGSKRATVVGIAFSPDGSQLAAACCNNTAKVWNLATGHQTLTLVGHTAAVYSVAFSRDSLLLATASEDTTVRIWSSKDGKSLAELKGNEEQPPVTRAAHDLRHHLTKVAFHPLGHELAVGSRSGEIAFWDIQTRSLRLTLNAGGEDVSVAYSRDGTKLASANRKTTTIWNVKTGDEMLVLKDPASDVCFSPDGRRIVSLSSKSARIWDTQAGQKIFVLNDVSGLSVRFSPDGRRIATMGKNGFPQIFDSSTNDVLVESEVLDNDPD